MWISKCQGSLVYKLSSKTARGTYRETVLKNKASKQTNKQKQKTERKEGRKVEREEDGDSGGMGTGFHLSLCTVLHEPMCSHLPSAPLSPALREASKPRLVHSLAGRASGAPAVSQFLSTQRRIPPEPGSKVSSSVLVTWTEIKNRFHSL